VPVVLALAVQLVVGELPLVETDSVLEEELAVAVLLATRPLPAESLPTTEIFAALAGRKTLLPLAIVAESVGSHKLPLALGVVTTELPHIFVTISISKSTRSVSINLFPMTLIEGPVFPC
jgi:hypothetical protein